MNHNLRGLLISSSVSVSNLHYVFQGLKNILKIFHCVHTSLTLITKLFLQ